MKKVIAVLTFVLISVVAVVATQTSMEANFMVMERQAREASDKGDEKFFKDFLTKQISVSKFEKYEKFDQLIEEFSFLIKDFKMNHQSENNNLNIKVRYAYKTGIPEDQYPDFRLILKDIQDFLSNYPNDVDYWEIVNKKLTLMVLKKYPVLSSITSEMQVSPSALDPYSRSSTVTRYQPKNVRTNNKKSARRNRAGKRL